MESVRATTELSSVEFLWRRVLRSESYSGFMDRYRDRSKWQAIDEQIASYSEARNHDVSVLQIGANDGRHNDPVYGFITKFGWSGLLVEPGADAFARLRETYEGHDDLQLINAAVSENDGYVTLYSTGQSDSRLQGKDSLHQEVIAKHAWMTGVDMKEIVGPIRVPSLTLKSLLGNSALNSIDIIVTDTAGHDGVIMRQLFEEKALVESVYMVMYEHCHLALDDSAEIDARLRHDGFKLTKLRRDTVAQRAYVTEMGIGVMDVQGLIYVADRQR